MLTILEGSMWLTRNRKQKATDGHHVVPKRSRNSSLGYALSNDSVVIDRYQAFPVLTRKLSISFESLTPS
jgi:hypothetical protein